jgi:hypothetical protein
MKLPFLFIMASFFGMLAANAQEVDEEAVSVMKNTYYQTFANLPPSRNCQPGDLKGLWVEHRTFENPAAGANAARGEKGSKYLRFGGYNQYGELRSKRELAHDAVDLNADDVLKQYIVSIRGLLYFYVKSELHETKLCFIATESNKEHVEGELMLMDLLEEKKPLIALTFRPVSIVVEKGKKNVR